MSSKNGMKEYNKGINCLKTSCLKCRFNPDFTSAIPYLKTASDEFHACNNYEKEIESRHHLITCFQKEESFWEEGKEHEKISYIYLTKLKSYQEAYDSFECAYNAYIKNHSYEDGIKCLMKASDSFLEEEKEQETEKCLELSFEGINKYYHVMTMNENESHKYIYDCIDKYIDFNFGKEKYKKCISISKKSVDLIKSEKKDDINLLDKYYGLQALGEILDKQDNKYNETIDKGMKYNNDSSGLCYKINYLLSKIKNGYKEEENKTVMDTVYEISGIVPNNVYKKLYRYVENYKISDNKNENEKDKITDYDDDFSDLK
jgi:hypothetical protein